MKKLLAVLSAITIAAAAAPASVFAAPDPEAGGDAPATKVLDAVTTSGTTDVSYVKNPGYTVTIPASINYTSDADVSADIVFDNVYIGTDKTIYVYLTESANTTEANTFDFKLKNGEAVATYHILRDNGARKVGLGGEAARFAYTGASHKGTKTLTFTKPEGAAFAGTYTDTLTFTISVGDSTVDIVPPPVG